MSTREIPPDPPASWNEFVTAYPDYADRIDAAFLLDLARDDERGRTLVEGIEKLRTGDALPDAVATLAGELRAWRRSCMRSRMEEMRRFSRAG